MFPKAVPVYASAGTISGTISPKETSTGKVWIDGLYSYVTGVAQTLEIEHWNGSAWESVSVAVGVEAAGTYGNVEVSSWTYTVNSKLRARLYYAAHSAYSSYTSEGTTSVAATGGLSAYVATLTAACTAVTIDGDVTGSYPTAELSVAFSSIPVSIQVLSNDSLIKIHADWVYLDAGLTSHVDDEDFVGVIGATKTLTEIADFNVYNKSLARGIIYLDQAYFPDLSSSYVEVYNQYESPF